LIQVRLQQKACNISVRFKTLVWPKCLENKTSKIEKSGHRNGSDWIGQCENLFQFLSYVLTKL